MEYDYVVESFYTEYKLDTAALCALLIEYENETSESRKFEIYLDFKKLYPEYSKDNLNGLTVEELKERHKTVKKKIWFVQPPRDPDTGKPLYFYSLKSRLLTGLRNLRKEVKVLQKQAGSSGDKVNEVRYNAMQLAIKIIMNTEYGASGNKLFAHYDPDIAGAVTYLSRTLIGFLTKTLEGETFYVDKRFLDENKQVIDRLLSIKYIKDITPIPTTTSDLVIFDNRVRVLRRVFDDTYKLLDKNLYKLTVERSQVIYQDTDSNYYINPYIQKYYTSEHMTPTDIKECMVSMSAHNDFINNLAVAIINRTPVGLGFEGAFIICRYFHRKKKYYGKKYDDSLLPDIPEGKRWSPKLSCAPMDNGDYIYLDDAILLSHNDVVAHGKQKQNSGVVNYLDYIKEQGIKCTGVNLARRDQYKFINYYHMKVIQSDMRLIEKINGSWALVKEKSLKDLVHDITEHFKSIAQTYIDIANGKIKEIPKGLFKLIDFSRPKIYDESKQGPMQKIVKRMKKDEERMKEDEESKQYIPENGERINIVVVMSDDAKNRRLKGSAGMGQTGERSFRVEELIDETKKKLWRQYTAQKLGTNIDPNTIALKDCIKCELDENYVDAIACSQLDFKYYMKSLADAMALYTVDEEFPNEIQQINQGTFMGDEEKFIDKLQKAIGKSILDEYYPPKTKIATRISRIDKMKPKKIKGGATNKYPATRDQYIEMTSDELVEDNVERIRADAEMELSKAKQLFKAVSHVYSMIETDKLLAPSLDNELEERIYKELGDNEEKYDTALQSHNKSIKIYERILNELKNVI